MEHNDSDFIISENRIDIIIGVEYVKAYIGKLKTNFFEKLYISNKRSFNGLREKDWNHGWENPKQKRGKFAFIKSFNRLIDSIKESGTNSEPIPLYLGDKNELWVSDGMHRAAACYGLGLPVNVEIHNEPDGITQPILSFLEKVIKVVGCVVYIVIIQWRCFLENI